MNVHRESLRKTKSKREINTFEIVIKWPQIIACRGVRFAGVLKEHPGYDSKIMFFAWIIF